MTLLEQRRTVNQRQIEQKDQRVFQQCIGTYYPRVLLGILVALIALMHTARAQDTSQIPTLQLWYEAKGISHVNYLEGYDKQGGGDNALIVRKNSRPQLWYLKDGTIDTSSARPVPDCDPYWVGEVDLNGDGLKEMIDWRANVFVRPNAGEPYGLQSVARYAETGKAFFYGSRTFIGDFDGDGKEDFMGVYRTQTMIARLLMGGNDLTKLRVIDLPRIPDPAYTLQYVVGAWREADGTNKIVVYQQLDTGALEREEAFFLYSFRIAGDSVLYTPLDTTEFKTFKDKVTPYYFYEGSFVWHSKLTSKHTLITASLSNTDFYTIAGNKLTFRWNKKSKPGCMGIVNHSLNIPSERGTIFGWFPFAYLYDGNPSEDTTARAWLPLDFEEIHSIIDINNDGITDYVTTSPTSEKMKIYLGRQSNVSVDKGGEENKGMEVRIIGDNPQNQSSPIRMKVNLLLSSEIKVMMYNIRGQVVQVLYESNLESGEHTLVLPVNVPLQSGMYNLRISDGRRYVDKGIIIIN